MTVELQGINNNDKARINNSVECVAHELREHDAGDYCGTNESTRNRNGVEGEACGLEVPARGKGCL